MKIFEFNIGEPTHIQIKIPTQDIIIFLICILIILLLKLYKKMKKRSNNTNS